jgi:flagellar biosynthesis protein FliQ
MSFGSAIEVVQGAIIEVIKIAGPILLIGMAVGLVIAILQATTSIQEQTLTFVPKIAAILVGLIILGRFLLNDLVQYTRNVFLLIGQQ